MTTMDISDYLVRLDKEMQEFKTKLLRISWFMRGGVSYNELLHVYSSSDVECMNTVISDNLTATKETGKVFV